MKLRALLASCCVLVTSTSCALFNPDPPTILVFDASSSMLQDDADGLRIHAAKQAAKELIDAFPTRTPLGIVVYGNNIGDSDEEKAASCKDVSVVRSLEGINDRPAAYNSIGDIQPRGWTPLVAAIEKAVDQLPDDKEANIIVLSDGEDTCGGDLSQLAKNISNTHPHMRIDAVSFKDDAHHLRDLTASTGGIAVNADNPRQLIGRLKAVRDADLRDSLNDTGVSGVNLGDSITKIQQAKPNFPDTKCTDSTCVVTFDNCEYTFIDGELRSIKLLDGSTIDGIAIGDNFDTAKTIWGEPTQNEAISDERTEYLFPAGGENSWRVIVEGSKIISITLCQCDKMPAQTTNDDGVFQLRKEINGVSVGDLLGDLPNVGFPYSPPQMGKYFAFRQANGVFIFAEEKSPYWDAKVSFVLPLNYPDKLHFADRAEADAYFGKPVNHGVDNNVPFAFYATSDPKVFFLVQWLPGKADTIEITPVTSANDFGSGQPLTALGGMAAGFGIAGRYDMNLKESELSNPKTVNQCSIYELEDFNAMFQNGKLLGFYSAPQTMHSTLSTARGIRAGATVEDVQRAYSDLDVVYTGPNHMNPHIHIQSPNNPDIYLGFGVDNGTVTSVRTGTKEFAQFYETCVSHNG